MKLVACIVRSFVLIITISCTKENETPDNIHAEDEQNLRSLTQQLDDAEVSENLGECIALYEENAISMPEYQVTLGGRNEIENYYREIFKRQRIKTIRRQPLEFIHLENTIVVIGTYSREYAMPAVDSSITLQGKYCHVWGLQAGEYRIKGETFGYFHPVDHPEALIISTNQQQPDEDDMPIKVPFELKAYNALMEKGVRARNATLRADFFTEDAVFYPFADTAIVGMNQLKPYLNAYSSRGTVTIDAVSCYTYAFENLGDYTLEYAMFKVKWSRPDVSGRTEGKGIRIWKRQEDKSLKLFREIGTHNLL
jgi:ketosteroid isomerase-like protein